ncbi:Avr9/Cf-9 rapidly elicited protein [Hirschfeldia incana]|nr:Avr9/Cf-9 rapidly elicited protein [Hirschfeldia incana]
MMSIFSPFEALYAESNGFQMKLLGGQKQSSGDSQSPAAGQQKNCGRLPVSSDNEKSKKEKKIQPVRMAPELDGVHCFETIFPF